MTNALGLSLTGIHHSISLTLEIGRGTASRPRKKAEEKKCVTFRAISTV